MYYFLSITWKNILSLAFFILEALKVILQHFIFVNWWIRGFLFLCHEQVISLVSFSFVQGSLSLHTAVITRLLLSKIEPDCASGFRQNRQKSWKQDGHYFWRPSMDLQGSRRIQQPGCKLLPPSWLQTWPVYSTVYGEQAQFIY